MVNIGLSTELVSIEILLRLNLIDQELFGKMKIYLCFRRMQAILRMALG